MRLPWTPEFSRQVIEFNFKYTCQDCGHYVPDKEVCAHAWPRLEHRRPHTDPQRRGTEVVFCKEYELP